MAKLEDTYSVQEVAAHLRLSERQVRYAIDSGALRASNVGMGKIRPVWRIKRSEIDRFWAKRSKR